MEVNKDYLARVAGRMNKKVFQIFDAVMWKLPLYERMELVNRLEAVRQEVEDFDKSNAMFLAILKNYR